MNLNRCPQQISRTWRVLGVALLCLATVASAAPPTVRKLAYQGEMPYVVADDVRVAQRINNVIYLDVLGVPPPAKYQDGLKPKKSDGGLTPVSEVAFAVTRNDATILALSVSYEGCGAYCENHTLHFNFETATGRNVSANSLFTAAGALAVNRQVDAVRLARLKAGIADVRKSAQATAKSQAVSKDEASDFERAIAMYEDCVRSMTDPEMQQFRRIDLSLMLIGRTGISVVRERCSNHAMRALDDVGDVKTTISFSNLAPHLSAYGKYLLLGGDRPASTEGPLDQVLFGKIGASPITFRLGARDSKGGISGLYYYDRFRTPISLFGTLAGNTLLLEEDAAEGKAKPVIRATISGDALSGQWIGGGKQLAFEAAP